MPASIRVENERETGRGWAFDVFVERADEQGTAVKVTFELSWVDYEYWTHGLRSPADLVRDVMQFLVEREPLEGIKARLDASTIRRRHPEVDRRVGVGQGAGD